MQRREFLSRAGLAVGSMALASAASAAEQTRSVKLVDIKVEHPDPKQSALAPHDWKSVRAQFDLAPDLIHMSGFYLASHPIAVRQAIERHRRGLDANPIGYRSDVFQHEMAVLRAAGEYMEARPDDIALTDSTTMGLAAVYGAIQLHEGQEVLTTTHDHSSTVRSLKYRADRTGATVRSIPLYKNSGTTTADEIVSAISTAITTKTRLVAVTWVHSCSGVMIPVRAIADALATINRSREEKDHVILSVDGVHGFGMENATMPELGCDIFIAGTHKWIFGPRGTGVLWVKPDLQKLITPMIPPFVPKAAGPTPSWGMVNSPGGFHSFEHRWALDEAFKFHQRIGKARVATRIHALNRQLKEGMTRMSHITLHTPMSDKLSGGIVCFEAAGLNPQQVVDKLAAKKIVASVSPYDIAYPRLAPSLLNDEAEVETCLRALRELA